jgi:hypothetical protein
MTSHAVRHYPAAADLPRWLLAGLASGVVSVLVFQHGALGLLQMLGLRGMPVLWPLAIWGGMWGALLAAALGRFEGKRLVIGAAIFGAVLPTLAALAWVAPLQGQPVVTGVVPLAILAAAAVNGAWGLGTGIGLALFGRPRHPQGSTGVSHGDRRKAR